uniref:Uncharacterized protein n=1 Tax=Mesocestoides corti TaxID=53468 RepID=A0A5K3FI62_MESCO
MWISGSVRLNISSIINSAEIKPEAKDCFTPQREAVERRLRAQTLFTTLGSANPLSLGVHLACKEEL